MFELMHNVNAKDLGDGILVNESNGNDLEFIAQQIELHAAKNIMFYKNGSSTSSQGIAFLYDNKIIYAGGKFISYLDLVAGFNSNRVEITINQPDAPVFSYNTMSMQSGKYGIYFGDRSNNRIWIYDLEAFTMHQLPDLGLNMCGGGVIDGYLYVFGGRPVGETTVITNQYHRRPIDDFTSPWETIELAQPWERPVLQPRLISSGGIHFIVGGCDPTTYSYTGDGSTLSSYSRFDPVRNVIDHFDIAPIGSYNYGEIIGISNGCVVFANVNAVLTIYPETNEHTIEMGKLKTTVGTHVHGRFITDDVILLSTGSSENWTSLTKIAYK